MRITIQCQDTDGRLLGKALSVSFATWATDNADAYSARDIELIRLQLLVDDVVIGGGAAPTFTLTRC